MSYVKFEAPAELQTKSLEVLETAKNTGKIKKGVNEVTKAVERKITKLVVIAGDIIPPENVMHLPMLCDEKEIPYLFVNKKEDIGKAIGLKVPCSAACVVEEGKSNEILKDVLNKLKDIKKQSKI
ncbi:50S ribosomal protein L7Ae [groundwater metagenome]|uniref:50S ribosomal protein L7Ae n=1 Tax=groundwater metagenome TaxID=717931 RepID=A0A098E7S3_9ZZZZ